MSEDFLGVNSTGGNSGVGVGQDQGSLVFNLEEVEEDKGFELIPKGTYPAIVEELELQESSSGNPMFAVQFKITEGEYENRLLFDYWVLAGKGAEFGLGKLKKFLARICPEVDLANFDAQAFSDEGIAIGREVNVTVRIQTQRKGEYKGEKRNVVADFSAPSEGSFL